MMKLAVIALLGFSASAYAAACEVGLWGVNCNNVCVGCDDTGCDVEGKCTTGKCVDGFQAEEGVNCVSLRKDGIKGAFIALAVMIISIGSCGFIEVQRNKGKSKKD